MYNKLPSGFGQSNNNQDNKIKVSEDKSITWKALEVITSSKNVTADKNFKAVFSEPRALFAFMQSFMPTLFTDINGLQNYIFLGRNIVKEGNYVEDTLNYSDKEVRDYIKWLFSKQISESGKEIEYDVIFEYNITGTEDTIVNKDKIVNNLFTFNVEMQTSNPPDYNLVARSVYYCARLLSNILNAGEKYSKLHKVYSIWFLNFNYFDDENPIHYLGMRGFLNPDDFSQKYSYLNTADLMEVVFIELDKIDKLPEGAFKEFLNCLLKTNKEDFIKEVSTVFHLREEEVTIMLNSRTYIDTIKEEGREEGIEEGRIMADGRTIKNLMSKNMSFGDISDIMNLSINEIKGTLDKYNSLVKEDKIKE